MGDHAESAGRVVVKVRCWSRGRRRRDSTRGVRIVDILLNVVVRLDRLAQCYDS